MEGTPNQLEIPDRLVIVEQVYHCPFGQPIKQIESRYSRDLRTTEQAYERRIKVEESWQLLDCGWLEAAGMIVIRNHAGEYLQRLLTDAQKADLAKQRILVRFSSAFEGHYWIVPPGETFRGYPKNLRNVELRSEHGSIWATVYIIPE